MVALSANYAIEIPILEKNPTGLERARIERIVGSQYYRLLGQQQDSKAPLASKGTTTTDRGEKNRRPRSRFTDNCSNCGRKGHRAKKGAMPARLNVPAKPEVGSTATMTGEARGDRNEEWKLDSGAAFHMSHTRSGMIT